MYDTTYVWLLLGFTSAPRTMSLKPIEHTTRSRTDKLPLTRYREFYFLPPSAESVTEVLSVRPSKSVGRLAFLLFVLQVGRNGCGVD